MDIGDYLLEVIRLFTVSIYLFKFNEGNVIAIPKICSKLVMQINGLNDIFMNLSKRDEESKNISLLPTTIQTHPDVHLKK